MPITPIVIGGRLYCAELAVLGAGDYINIGHYASPQAFTALCNVLSGREEEEGGWWGEQAHLRAGAQASWVIMRGPVRG